MFCYNEGKTFKLKKDEEDNQKDDKKKNINKVSFNDLKNDCKLIKGIKSFDIDSNFQVNQKYFRKNIPFNLRGKKEKELQELTGIQNLIFVNKKLDTACGFTLKSVISLAEHAIYN